jgi:uncharacterized Zn-binding protein involved in type VI secretion
MPPAARVTDLHTCPLPYHVGGPINKGDGTVMIGFLPAARVGDTAVCVVGGMDTIASGSATVMVGGAPAARMGDSTSHGGTITAGFTKIMIG